MKIAFIGQKGIPAKIGGVERYTEELATKMAERGHEVFVYVRNNYTDKNLKTYRGTRLIHLPSIQSKNLDAISHTFLATWHALFQNYDVIQYHSIGPASLSILAKIFKRKTAIVAIYQCQDYLHQKWGALARAYLKLGEYITCKVPDKTIAVTKILADFAKKKFGADLSIIPNGTSASRTAESETLTAWGLEKEKYILVVSRFIRHKGIHYLIKAFKKLEDRNLSHEMKLVIVGEGFHTDQYVQCLKNIAKGRKNIIFTGPQSGEKLRQLFSHAYVFVQPSESEGLSIALLEAMAYGRAALISDIPENIEAVQDSAVNFANKNSSDLADKLAYLLNNPGKTAEIGNTLCKIAKERYNWDTIADQFETAYQEIINQKKLKLCEKYSAQKYSGQ